MNTEPTLRPSVVVSLTAVIAPSLPPYLQNNFCVLPSALFSRGLPRWLLVSGWVGGRREMDFRKRKKEVVSPFLPFLFRLPCVWGKRRALIPTEVDNNKGELLPVQTFDRRRNAGISRSRHCTYVKIGGQICLRSLGRAYYYMWVGGADGVVSDYSDYS